MPTMNAMVVYQGGVANVFQVDTFNYGPFNRNAKRLLQGSFRECETFARGMMAAGADVRSASCNRAGDVTDAEWSAHLAGVPFANEIRPVEEPCRG